MQIVGRRVGDRGGIVEISDPDDPRLADYRDLRDVELRKSLEAEHGLFLAEGEKVVRRSVEAGYAPRSFLMAPRWLEGLDDIIGRSDGPCYVLSEALLEQVTGFHVHRGALASLHRRPLPPVEEVLAGARSVLVLEDLVDHTNVGAIFRSGAALGFDAVLLAPRCADPRYRRSIKVGMGAVFTTGGSLVWNAALILAGYELGAQWHVVEAYVGGVGHVVWVLLAVVLVVVVARRLRRRERDG